MKLICEDFYYVLLSEKKIRCKNVHEIFLSEVTNKISICDKIILVLDGYVGGYIGVGIVHAKMARFSTFMLLL